MIDWLTFRVPVEDFDGIKPGMVVSIDPEGNIEWQTMKWMHARGSWDTTMGIKPFGNGELTISGNPAKYLQGHNVFGSDDVRGLASATLQKVSQVLPISLPPNFSLDECKLTRVDINYSFATGSRSNTLAWINAAEKYGNLQHRGKGMMKGTSVYWGKKSRHWSLKAYAKGEELEAKNHGLPVDLPRRTSIKDFADDLLRVELQLRRQLKTLDLKRIGQWKPEIVPQIFMLHLDKLSLTGTLRLEQKDVASLPNAVRMTYIAWQSGQDVRGILSRRTFYRHRRQLLPYGVDIATSSPDATNNVVPLIRYIEAVPVAAPDWAHGTELLFGS